jgi:hypothetical protein
MRAVPACRPPDFGRIFDAQRDLPPHRHGHGPRILIGRSACRTYTDCQALGSRRHRRDLERSRTSWRATRSFMHGPTDGNKGFPRRSGTERVLRDRLQLNDSTRSDGALRGAPSCVRATRLRGVSDESPGPVPWRLPRLSGYFSAASSYCVDVGIEGRGALRPEPGPVPVPSIPSTTPLVGLQEPEGIETGRVGAQVHVSLASRCPRGRPRPARIGPSFVLVIDGDGAPLKVTRPRPCSRAGAVLPSRGGDQAGGSELEPGTGPERQNSRRASFPSGPSLAYRPFSKSIMMM